MMSQKDIETERLNLSEDERIEYDRMVDGLCRMSHIFETTPEIHNKAIEHAKRYIQILPLKIKE